MAEERRTEIYIPVNVFQSNRVFGIRKRNLAEGAITAAIIGYGIYQIPFVPGLKYTIIGVISIITMFLCIWGIHGRTLTETIWGKLKMRKLMHQIHYRRMSSSNVQLPICDAEGNVKIVKEIQTDEQNTKRN